MADILSTIKRWRDWDWPVLSLLFSTALLRTFFLSLKVPHFDEGVNGWFVDRLVALGYYPYDPSNYHGPLHFYILLIFKILFGRNLWALRLPLVLISILNVWWMTRFSRFFGRGTAFIAALAMAVSPGFEFYSRYAIHEPEFVFLQVLFLWGLMGLWYEGDRRSLWYVGMSAAGMVLTKETYVIHLACFLIAWFCLRFWERFSPSTGDMPGKSAKSAAAVQTWTADDLSWVIVVGISLVVFFYSGTFLNFPMLNGLYETFGPWFKTGTQGNGHDKAFWYWAWLFSRYEQVALVGLIGCARFLWSSSKWIRYVCVYGLGVFFAYSIVHYKTPWCVISLLWPFYFPFARLLIEALRTPAKKSVILASSVLLLGSLFVAIRLNFFHATDKAEPYVYVQTFDDIKKLTEPVLQMARQDPANYNMQGHVILSSNWPLPWIFGDFTRVGYYTGFNFPTDLDGDFLAVERTRIAMVEVKLRERYFTENMNLRDAQDSTKIYLRADKFQDLFPNRTPEFVPAPQPGLGPGEGLVASYFSNAEWEGHAQFQKVVGNVDFQWSDETRPLPAPFGILFTGEIYIPRSGAEFFLTSDDGSYLELNGKRLIDNLGIHPEKTKSGRITAVPGWQRIRIGFNDFGGGAVIRLAWRLDPGDIKQIPSVQFRHSEKDLKP